MINSSFKYFVMLFVLLQSSVLWAALKINPSTVPGGVAVIEFSSKHTQPKAFYYDTPVFIQNIARGKYQALVGIPLMTKPGEKVLTIKDETTREVSFVVNKTDYPSQYITLKGDKKKYVDPPKKQTERINKERPILAKARQTLSDNQQLSGSFIAPTKGIISSRFGLKRFYNNKPRSPHAGLDFAAKTDTPIVAPIAGKVILVGDFFFNGKTVFLDHGQGLISVYIHMNHIAVNANQMVKQGDLLGGVGQTGRSTGPHLHWGIYLNSTAVNPEVFVDVN